MPNSEQAVVAQHRHPSPAHPSAGRFATICGLHRRHAGDQIVLVAQSLPAERPELAPWSRQKVPTAASLNSAALVRATPAS